jgi:hypothetical protein
MWMILPRKVQLTIVVLSTLLLAGAIQAAVGWLSGDTPSSLKIYSLIVFVVGTVLVTIFNLCWRWLWRKFPVLAKITFPDLNGTWTGTLHSKWKDPKTGKSPGPIEITVWIRQSLLTVSVKQQTLESKSWSTRSFIEADAAADRYLLWYSYNNKPHANVLDLSPEHEGVCHFEMNFEQNAELLKGQYYTSRSSAGNMQIQRVARAERNPSGRAHWSAGSSTHPFRWDE